MYFNYGKVYLISIICKVVTMKEELSDFLKMAYKYNKVKDLREAFEEFPIEEWHKGKVETYNKNFYEKIKKEK